MRKLRRSIMTELKELGTRAALMLFAFLLLNKGKKKAVSLMIREATLGGHQIRHEARKARTPDDNGDYEVLQEGHTIFVTPTAWIERRRNLIAAGVITEFDDPYLMEEKAKRGSGPRAFTFDGREVLAITADMSDYKTRELITGIDHDANGDEVHWSYLSRPIVRSFLLPSPVAEGQSEWVTVDHRTREGSAFFQHLQQQGWKLHEWANVPCMLSKEELDELKLLDMVYRVCVDLGLQKQKFLAKSSKKLQILAEMEQERTKGGLAEFSGRPDDGMEGFVGGGLTYARDQETDQLILDKDGKPIQFETSDWSMAEEDLYLNGYKVPQRPSKAEFMKDLAWGWACRLEIVKKMVILKGDQGQDVWVDVRDPAYKSLTVASKRKLPQIPVLDLDPVRIEADAKGACTVRKTWGRPTRIEPMGLIRRHLHNLMQLGQCTYVLQAYVCKECNGTGYAQGVDEDGALQVDDVGQAVLVPCGKCRGSGCGAPGYHINYETGLATPNVAGAKVTKPESFACKGKGKPCGNREFLTDIHAEVCTRCGAEMWKNSMIVLFDRDHTSEAFTLPDEATHAGARVYGQLVRDMVRARHNRVVQAKLAGKRLPPIIGTKVMKTKSGMLPNILDSMADLQPKKHKVRGSLAYVIGALSLKSKAKGWDEAIVALENKPEHRPGDKRKTIRVDRNAFDPKPMGADALGVVDVLHRAKAIERPARTDEQVKAQLLADYRKWSKQFLDLRKQIRKELGR